MAPAVPGQEQPAVEPSAAAKTPFILPPAGSEALTSSEGQAAAPAGPSQADIAAAANMSAEDRASMIRSMVESLDARMSENPDNLEGWLRLVRSYAVLGDRSAAQTALERAGTTFAAESDGGRALAELAAQLGLEPVVESQ
jgi:cytochrome c-type biogenesis protein CcmH